MMTGGQGHEMLKTIENNRALQRKPGQLFNVNTKALFAKISDHTNYPALRPKAWTPQRRAVVEAKIREYRLQEKRSWVIAAGISLFLFALLAYFIMSH